MRPTRPLTTLHLTNAWHPTSGGIRTFYTALLDAANRHRRRVVVVAPAARTHSESIGDFGVIHFLAAPRAPAFDRRYRMLYPHRYFPVIGRSLAGILERERPDIVEVCDKYSLPYLAAMLRKGWLPRVPRPLLVGLSCERFDDNMAAYLDRGRMARRFTQWYIRNVYGPPFDVHVANSEYTAGELRAALPDRSAGFIRVCPMGVDTHGFSPGRRSAAMRARLLRRCGGDERTRLLFYGGRLSPEKNLELLVDTLRRLATDQRADYRLIVAGDGPRAAWLEAQATGVLHGRILLCGNLDRSALAECCASCDVFVHPNHREPFGIGPLEAMASGVPVVVPDSGGVLTYATAANAWIAGPTAAAFSAAVRAALRGDAERLGAALATAHAFRWEDATRRYFELYDSVHAEIAEPAGWRDRSARVIRAGDPAYPIDGASAPHEQSYPDEMLAPDARSSLV
jgi:alpha-1,6-mannosyltransferase